MRIYPRLAVAASMLAAGSIATPAQMKSVPGDWPAWRGPDRTGVSLETGLLKEWPAGGPKLAWRTTGIGRGYSTPSIAASVLYLLGTAEGEAECLLAVSAKREGWRRPLADAPWQVAGRLPWAAFDADVRRGFPVRHRVRR